MRFDTIFRPVAGIETAPMGRRATQWWVDQAITEVTDVEFASSSMRDFVSKSKDAYKEGRIQRIPPTVQIMQDLLEQYSTLDLPMSSAMFGVIGTMASNARDTKLVTWSLVIETLRNDNKPVTLMQMRSLFKPSCAITEKGIEDLYERQIIERDPITRSTSWLDKPEAWTLEGLAAFNEAT